MGRKKGRCVRRNAVSKEIQEPEHLVKAPHSFIIHRGNVNKHTTELTRDFRKVMEPFTASRLKERKNNKIKDFLSISGYLHVSHMCIFTETSIGTYLKLARLPRGPTLSFKVHSFCLSRDVISSTKKQYVIMKAFQSAPLIVLNNFSGEGMHMKLMANMFQNMFPTINITNVKLKSIRRCVLLNYNSTTKTIDFRHYVIKSTPVGLNRGTKKMIQGKIPNLSRCQDMSEFFDRAGMLSESEFEDDPNAEVVLPQDLAGRGANENTQSSIRLHEVGPRMSLQLMKVEDGLLDGEVLFHELVYKTEQEKELIRKKREEKRKLKEKRKKTQEENTKRKEAKKEELKQKALEGIKRKREQTETQRLMELAAAESLIQTADSDDDAAYYKKEVGVEPERDLFSSKRKSRDGSASAPPGKKPRLDKQVKERMNNKKGAPKKKLTVGGRFNKDRQNPPGGGNKQNKKIKGRGGNPVYGWRARQNESENVNENKEKTKNKPFKKGLKKTTGKPLRKGKGNKTGQKSKNKKR